MLRTTGLLCALVALSASVEAGTITVALDGSGDYEDIQSALDAAEDGDEVVVAPGEYVIAEPIDFNRGHVPGDWAPRGKNLVLRSEEGPAATTIRMAAVPADPNRASVVIFDAGETDASVLEGFTLTGGQGTHLERVLVFFVSDAGHCGGGVFCRGWMDLGARKDCESSCWAECEIPVEECLEMWGCHTEWNEFCDGCFEMGSPFCGELCYHECQFTPGQWRDSSPTIRNCVVAGNTARRGGGVFSYGASPVLEGCTISGNCAWEGGGVADGGSGSAWDPPTLTDCIVWDNVGGSLDLEECVPNVSCSCFEGPEIEGETDNLHVDPLFCGYEGSTEVFVDAEAGGPGDGGAEAPFPSLGPALAYRLSLQAGSPCIGAGSAGSTLGASLGSCGAGGPDERVVRLAAGSYALEGATLAHHASLVGQDLDATVVEGSVHGLRTGARIVGVAVTGGVRGGVIVSGGETPTIERCEIAGAPGAGMVCSRSSPTAIGCLVAENSGGGLLLVDSSPDVVHSTVAGNASGGLICQGESSPLLVDTIVWSNAGEAIQADDTSHPVVSYSCVQADSPWPGEGSIQEDPRFVAPGHVDDGGTPDDPSDDTRVEGDYRLLPASPCVDAGKIPGAATVDLDGHRRWCGLSVDIGAYEIQTGQCLDVPFIRGDVNVDTCVDISDAVGILVYLFALDQLPGAAPTCLSAADADDDGAVNLTDAVYALEFLFRGGPRIPAPWPKCGEDPTADGLGCDAFVPCEAHEACDNLVDDDHDGLVDCEDPDCSAHAACPEICDNGIDDDADGLVDCHDSECGENPACAEICGNSLDDDVDGLVDCEDPDCSADAACPEICDNDADDDADGLVDCEDPECLDVAVCIEICDNGGDDDTVRAG